MIFNIKTGVITSLLLFIVVCAKANDQNSTGRLFDPNKVRSILEKSIFNGDSPPSSMVHGTIDIYDPILISVVASLRSRFPSRRDEDWREINLPPSRMSEACQGSIKSYVKASKTNSPYTFIIFPGSYATWSRGSFVNQTVEALVNNFDDPNVITFAGYLSPQFLSGSCDQIPWDGISLAEDIYLRLKELLSTTLANSEKTGIIGYSGGGFLAASILAHDSISVKMGGQRVIGLGGVSFSPLLHGRTTFKNLDTRFKESQIDRTLGLTTLDWKNILYLLQNLGPPSWTDVLNLYKDNPKEFIDRAFNEFTNVDLVDTLDAVGFDESRVEGDLSYYNVYVNTAFRMSQLASIGNLNKIFDLYTSVDPVFASIDRPFLIYFSQDDPVLSSHDGKGQPGPIHSILERAVRNKNIILYNPRYGAHTGVLLDPIFNELLGAMFGDLEQAAYKLK